MPGLVESVASTAQMPVASWYTQSISDGLGDRLLMSDNTSTSSLELLRFRTELAGVPNFERTVRLAVAHLSGFEHPAFSQVRSVEHLAGDLGLALVSGHIPGRRLSELFQSGDKRGVHPAFVAWLIRWLTPALADFSRETGLAHGTITPERIVLAPDGRPVFVEHVLGKAIEQLALSTDQLWHHFGIVVPPSRYQTPVFDERSDIFQLGSVALSLLLGRRITPAEHSGTLDLLLAEFAGSPIGRTSSFTPTLCVWLDRALRSDGYGFQSAQDACDGMRELSDAPKPDMSTRLSAGASRPEEGSSESGVPGRGRLLINNSTSSLLFSPDVEPQRRFVTARNVAAVLAVLVLTQGVVIAMLLGDRPEITGPALAPLRIESPRAGDVVLVDGREVGVTPLDLTVAASMRTLRVMSGEAPRAQAETPPSAVMAPVLEPATARTQATGIRLVSPIDLQVLKDGRQVGSSADSPIILAAGLHDLEFVNEALSFRSRQTVEVRKGETRAVTVQPPGGRVSINAVPWARVWIDGQPAGETPLAYLPLSAGAHEIIFRHPELGERRQTVLVQSGAVMRVSATFTP